MHQHAAQLALARPPMLPRRRSVPLVRNFNHNWAVTDHFHNSYHLLKRFLPSLGQASYQSNTQPELLAQQLSYSSTDIMENGSFSGLSARHLEEMYSTILRAIQASTSDHDVSMTIQTLLEQSFHEDEMRIDHGRQMNHSQALLRFRALSEISRQTNSLRIGHLLSAFFLSYGESLMQSNDLNYISQWTSAIHGARMQIDPKRSCQTIIVDCRPDIIEYLKYDSDRYAQNLGRELARVANELDLMDVQPRGRNWNGFNRRRLFSRSRSPGRLLDGRRGGMLAAPGEMIRPSSAPGVRQIAHQAQRVICVAQEMRNEAERLRDLVI